MKKRMQRLFTFVTLALASACGNTPPPEVPVPPPMMQKPVPSALAENAPVVVSTPDAPFRERAPEASAEMSFQAPSFVRFKSKGLTILLTERHELPIVSMRLVVHAGAGDSPTPWKYAALGAMLEQGTQLRTALQVSDDFETLGAEHGAWFDWDAGGLYARVLASKSEDTLKLLADEWLRPSFPAEELERVRTRRLTSLTQEKTSPGAMAQNAIAASLFGRKHPYGNPLFGLEKNVKALTRDDVVKLHAELKKTAELTLVVSGDASRAQLESWVSAAFGEALEKRTLPRGGAAVPVALPESSASGGPKMYFVHLAKATQSTVMVAAVGLQAKAQDRDSAQVMNAIFGGTFASRVNMNLREKHAYTYGARSRFSMRRGAGPFSVGGAMVAEHTGDALREILSEVDKMASAEPSAEELALAKNSLRLSLPGRFETASDVASALAELQVYGFPDDEFATKSSRTLAVTGNDVLRVAKATLDKRRFRVVVVGDREKVLPQLQALNLGVIQELDAFGEMLQAASAVATGDAKK
jgi:zinc protease